MDHPLFNKFNRLSFRLIALILGGGVILGGLAIRLLVTNSNSQADLTKATVPVSRQTLQVIIKASGVVEPTQSVNISPKAPGRLMSLLVEQGAVVKAGQLLAIMDNRELKAQELQIEGQLQQSQGKLKEAEVNIPSEIEQARIRVTVANNKVAQAADLLKQSQKRIPRQIDQASAQLKQAQSRLELARARAVRNKYLIEQGAISKDQYDAVVNELSIAEANLADLKQRLEEIKGTSSPQIAQLQDSLNEAKATAAEAKAAYQEKENSAQSQLIQLQASVSSAQGQYKQIEVQFDDTRIKAPFDGIITQRYADIGSFVTPSTSVSSSTDDSAPKTSILALAKGLQIRAKVPEVDIGQLRPGEQVKITADAYPDLEFKGRIIRIAPEAVKEQGVTSFDVIIALNNGQEKLRSKMNVNLVFLGNSIPNALVVPTVSIVTKAGKTGVMILDSNNKSQFQLVRIGTVIDDKTQIISGIASGQRVFIDLPNNNQK